jgi:hypothetical protein
MLKFNYIYPFLSLFLLLGCSPEEINYNLLSAEEVEILYNNNNPELLNLVCEKYHDESTTTTLDQWLILDDNAYQDKVNQNFYHYCKLVYDNGNKDSACLLKEYYKEQVSENKLHFFDFIYYLQECGNEESINNFINKDSIVIAITEIIQTLLSKDTPKGLDSLIQFFIKVEKTFTKCEKDLRQIYETIDSIEESIVLCENDLESINDTSLVLFTTQYHDLLKIVKILKDNFIRRRLLAVKVKNNDISIDIFTENINKLEINFDSINKLYDNMQIVTDQINNHTENSSSGGGAIVDEFNKRKVIYFTKYIEAAN